MTDTNKIIVAVLIAALLVGGAILLANRPANACDEWNDKASSLVSRMQSMAQAPAGTVPQSEIDDAQAESRAILADHPEDCEISREVSDKLGG